jgi:hypothetical protein
VSVWDEIDVRRAEFQRELRMSRKLLGLGWSVTSGGGWLMAKDATGRVVRAANLKRLLWKVRRLPPEPVQLPLPF